jgi:hypothetical protein
MAIHRILKCIGISRFIKNLVFFRRQVHLKISLLFKGIRTIAGDEEEREYK